MCFDIYKRFTRTRAPITSSPVKVFWINSIKDGNRQIPNKAMLVQNLIFTNRIASQELRAGLLKINGYKLVDMLLMPLEYHSR